MYDLLHFLSVFSVAARAKLMSTNNSSDERSELLKEIRRMTSVLEYGRRHMWRNPRP
jgi:hypothetical protein